MSIFRDEICGKFAVVSKSLSNVIGHLVVLILYSIFLGKAI